MTHQPGLAEIGDIVDRLCREAYQRGWNDAVANIMRAATSASPESAVILPSPARRAAEGGRPIRQDRDDAVADLVLAHEHGLTLVECKASMSRRGNDIPLSSLRVVLDRLIDAGRVQRVGRLYVGIQNSSEVETADLLSENAVSTPEPAEESQHGTALAR